MADILTSINTRKTSQGQKARADQVKNNAGGWVFEIGDRERLHRFLTLGTAGNTFYVKEIDQTRENAEVVFRMVASHPDETIADILAVSEAGRAPKNDQAIFALAIAASAEDTTTRQKALAVLHRVCRTSTHLFMFNTYVGQFRGRGPTLNRAIGNWYKLKPVDKLAYQVTKYRERKGTSHRDILRQVKGYAGKTGEISPERDALLKWVAKGVIPSTQASLAVTDILGISTMGGDLAIVQDFLDAQAATTPAQWVSIINRGHGVAWEHLPDASKKHPEVWQALLDRGMPTTALIRQLSKLTNVFGGPGAWVNQVTAQITDPEALKKGRVHPINMLIAMRTYAQGHGEDGKGKWTPIRGIVDALDAGFYASYGAVESTGKRRLLALDVSGSMEMVKIAKLPLTPREAAAAMTLVTLNAEPSAEIIGFSGTGRRLSGYGYGRNGVRVPFDNSGHGEPMRLDITPRRRLDDVINYTAGLPYGDTDCALPFTWAQKHGLDFDSVEIMTDMETWSGPIHVHQALDNYRNHVGHDVKLVAIGMTATRYSIADPKDNSGMNVSGFDSAVPNLISDFVSDRL
jgi:60 kDa SS-A/Ro ribonucleoprotein